MIDTTGQLTQTTIEAALNAGGLQLESVKKQFNDNFVTNYSETLALGLDVISDIFKDLDCFFDRHTQK